MQLGRRAAQPSPDVLKRLRTAFERKVSATSKQASGLVVAFADAIKKRARNAEMRGMSLDAARAHLLLNWDKHDFRFDFGAASSVAASGGGGGGGDPGEGSRPDTTQSLPPPHQPQSHAELDPRTRAFDGCLGAL